MATRRGVWTTDEKMKLDKCIRDTQDYHELAVSLQRSLWAVECQVMKYCDEKDIDPLSVGITQQKVDRFKSKKKKDSEKQTIEFENKLLQNKLITALIDFTDIYKRLDRIELNLCSINRKLDSLELVDAEPAGTNTKK